MVVEPQLSTKLYGDSVDLTDGISADEDKVVEAKADSIEFCLAEDEVEGPHYRVAIIE